MKNTRFFLTTIFTGLLFVACSDDDDGQPVIPGVSISTTETTFGEGDGTVTVSFSTTETFSNDVVLTYEVTGSATAGEDYTALLGTLTLSAGQSTVTQGLVLLDDDAVEQSEEIIITLTAVDGETDFIASNNTVTLTITDNDSFAFENGILVLHEGNFFGGNASVSFVSDDLSTVTNGIFTDVTGEFLGDVAQSMAFDGDLAYIVVNNSQKVEVVNRFSFESVGTVDMGLTNPRYMTFANDKGYVTNWGDGSNPDDDYVAVIDLANLTVESTIPVPEGPEWIINNGNTLYVAHQGGFNQNNIVSVIDASTNTAGDPITVADRPNSMQLVNDELWVLSGGNPAFTGNETAGQLDKIDVTTNTVEETFEFTQTDHPNYLSVDGNSLYYLLNGSVFKLDVSDTTLPTTAEITGVSFYDMTVNDGNLYGVDAKDFASNGSLEIYNLSDNSLTESLDVSIIPGGVYFNGAFSF
ncbi:MAG: Calx-beta domain-containing protein [Bacteroidota bacterium]